MSTAARDIKKINERAQKQLDILARISHATLHPHNVSTLLGDVLDILDTQMGMFRGILTLRPPDTDSFVIEASKGLTADEKKRGQYRLGEGVIGRVAQTKKPALIEDINREPSFLNKTRSRKKGEPVAFLCVPVIYRHEVIGTISIDRPVVNVSNPGTATSAAPGTVSSTRSAVSTMCSACSGAVDHHVECASSAAAVARAHGSDWTQPASKKSAALAASPQTNKTAPAPSDDLTSCASRSGGIDAIPATSPSRRSGSMNSCQRCVTRASASSHASARMR